MAREDKHLVETLKALLPYKDIITLVMERKIKHLEFNAFRYGGWSKSKGQEHYEKIIEMKKIKNLTVTLFRDAENLLDKL